MVDKITINKVKTVPADLGKLSNVVVNVVKKLCMMNWSQKLMQLILVS